MPKGSSLPGLGTQGSAELSPAPPRPLPPPHQAAGQQPRVGSDLVKNQVPKLDIIPNCSQSPGLETDFCMRLPPMAILPAFSPSSFSKQLRNESLTF